MSHEFMEVHEHWGLCVPNTLPVFYSVWVKITMNKEIAEAAESVGGKIRRASGTITFESLEDLTVFRLKAGI